MKDTSIISAMVSGVTAFGVDVVSFSSMKSSSLLLLLLLRVLRRLVLVNVDVRMVENDFCA